MSRKEVISCDSCHNEIEVDRDRFTVHVHSIKYHVMLDVCRACLKYQPIPLSDTDWKHFNATGRKQGADTGVSPNAE